MQATATHTRRGSHSSLGGSEDGGARGKHSSGERTRRKSGDDSDTGGGALGRLVQEHKDVYSSLTVNLREVRGTYLQKKWLGGLLVQGAWVKHELLVGFGRYTQM